MTDTGPPYLRIAATIRDRIGRGELRPGDRVPSARAIMREWGVAMATASKALAALQHEGVVEAKAGVGTVVRTRGAAAAVRPRPEPATALTTHRVVRTAIAVADREGLDALSMRRVAAEFGAGVMSLYRHVSNKDALVRLMVGEVFRERDLPADGPEGWRAKLELVSRIQWELYRRHPWLASQVSLTRPLLLTEAMAHTEWTLAALEGTGLPPDEVAREAVTLPAFVRGMALSSAEESEAERDTGLTSAQWWLALRNEVDELLGTGRFPWLAQLPEGAIDDLDTLFAHGLTRHLDGIEAAIQRQRARKQPAT